MRVPFWVIASVFVVILTFDMSSFALSDSTQTSNVSAEIILNQLRNDQPVVYDHAEIVGDLVVPPSREEMGSQAEKFANSAIIITNSTFRGDINFEGVLIKKPIIMEGCIIEGDATFRNASFSNLSRFNSTKFQKQADFELANFTRDAFFKNSDFQGECNFNGSEFMKEANFNEAKFKVARFTDCQFNGYSRFGKAVFQESANFEGSIFLDGASFNQAQFIGKAFLGWVKFPGRTYFTKTDFRDYASFSGSSFGYIEFDEANFAGETDFLNSSFEGNVRFVSTRFQKDAIFHKANFSSNVNLHGCDYDKLLLHWDSIRNHIKPDETLYSSMKENYKERIWITDVNECDFDYRHWKQSIKPWTDITKVPDIFLEWYCGYGTRPLNTVLWIGFFILIFGLYYWSKGGIAQVHKPGWGGKGILLIAKKVSQDTFNVEYAPEVTNEKQSNLGRLFLSLKFSLFVMASKNTESLTANGGIKWQAIELERWLGRGLFVIFMYYVGDLVTSYFKPLP